LPYLSKIINPFATIRLFFHVIFGPRLQKGALQKKFQPVKTINKNSGE
jgi:hypothetical protein